MRIGAIFPQTEIGADPAAVRAYAQAVEDQGFDHLLAYDHVIGANTAARPDWRGPYTHRDQFHEPLVLFGYLAAITQRIELTSGVIILPQRQTALVAKQAAEVDVLSGGRLRLGVGIGWNPVEFQALGQDFHTRGKRIEEQITLLRALFGHEVVKFEGRWDHVPDAGINPLPVRRSIPIWIGGSVEAVLERVVRLGDGWFPQMRPEPEGRRLMEQLHALATAAGRDPATIGIEARLNLRGASDAALVDLARAWQHIGATHVSINTMGAGLTHVDEHIAAVGRVRQALVAAGLNA